METVKKEEDIKAKDQTDLKMESEKKPLVSILKSSKQTKESEDSSMKEEATQKDDLTLFVPSV